MNNLDHVKNFYPENYKLDLSETMKAALSKGAGAGSVGSATPNIAPSPHSDMQQANGVGYVTEKLYMLLQLYLQNKGWNPSAELLQCFTDLKDNAMLPSAAYLQILANRLTLDPQGRLILRENGKIVLPFEHFANAVMLKHMSGPHGLHLSVDATVRAVIESYTIGRENFGMEKEFIIEVVQSCPSPACRYYKNHLGMSPLPFMEQQFSGVNPNDFLQHLPHLPPPPPHPMSASGAVGNQSAGNSTPSSSNNSVSSVNSTSGGEIDLTKPSQAHAQQKVPPQLQHLTKQQAAAVAAVHHQQQLQQQHQHQQQQQQQAAVAAAAKQQQQITAALIQQQNRALAQQSLEKFNSLSALEKQRVLQQLDPMAVAAAAANLQMQGLMQSQGSNISPSSSNSVPPSPSCSSIMPGNAMPNISNQLPTQLPPPPRSPTVHSTHTSHSNSSTHSIEQHVQKNVEVLRSNLESLESNKDLLALHNGAWGGMQDMGRDVLPMGQDKIVRVFAELMRNMARMKTYIRPSMCKPYGKQSESLQKTLLDTIQIVQTLRNCLPAPHIPVTSWKSESEGVTPAAMAAASGIAGTIPLNRVENLSN